MKFDAVKGNMLTNVLCERDILPENGNCHHLLTLISFQPCTILSFVKDDRYLEKKKKLFFSIQ